MEAKATGSRQILFVDDDPSFTAMMKEFFVSAGHGTWVVHAADNFTAALACLKTHPIDLVVLDIRLPVMDGLQLLTLIKRTHPKLPVVIATGYGTEEDRAYSLQNGAAMFLNKSTVIEAFDKVYAALEKLISADAEGFRGVLRRVGLTDVLQMECLGRKSSILEITTHSAGGRIFISEGSIIHAEAGGMQGETALFHLLSLTGGEFSLKPFTKPPRQTIDGSWESLVMEAARLTDEAAEAASARTGGAEAPAVLPAVEKSMSADRRINEIVLCSGTGEVLYKWQANEVDRRAQIIEFISAASAAASKALPLGRPDRLVIEAGDGRAVVLLQADRKVFVRSAIPAPAGRST